MIPAGDVEEATQEAFIAAFEGLASFRRTVPIRHWLCRIAIRKCNDYWRACTRLARKVHRLEVEQSISKGETAPIEAERVNEILDLLPPPERLVLSCIYIDDLTYEETAALLGSNIGALKVRVFRAKMRLRKLLRETREKNKASGEK